jgi:hypothetical protein
LLLSIIVSFSVAEDSVKGIGIYFAVKQTGTLVPIRLIGVEDESLEFTINPKQRKVIPVVPDTASEFKSSIAASITGKMALKLPKALAG